MSDLDFLQESRPDPAASGRRRLSAGTIVLLAGILSVVIVIGIAFVRSQQGRPESGMAPDFTLTTFDGQQIRLSDLRGQVVVLNFWASWCAPCREEAPALQSIWENYRDRGVLVLGVAYADDPDDSRAFNAEFGLTYPSGPDIGTVISKDQYHITGVPETFIIDRNGEIVTFIFSTITEPQIRAILDPLLAGETST
jgi:cytochrome c biogenesis protein CcmG/thiol:disulfide interchange protein DsbE